MAHEKDAPLTSLAWPRLAVRVASCLIALIVIDATVSLRFPTVSTSGWRMPRALPTSQIDVAAAAVESGSGRLVTFVGGSPAWGDAVESADEAVPARFEALVREQVAQDARVVNLACNGQLVGDSYVLAKYASKQGADLVIVQVTYHNLSPAGRDEAKRRYPELSDLLGVPITPEVASILGCEPTPRPDVSGEVERWLRRNWALYGQRERISAELYGGSPEQVMFSAWSERVNGFPTLQAEEEGPSSSFTEIDPGMQSVMADEWAMDADFTLDPKDSEVRMLLRLCKELRAEGTPVLVYLAPVNTAAIAEYGLLDEERFKRNVGRLDALVTETGAAFADLNGPEALPMDVFADINHTTPEGCELTAELLLAAVRESGGLR